ncbi:MAG TPA: hypothetical protein VH988_25865 [Thermoanaerobaculia bacterium]|jgi:hypothetical protein|nr:hypothetical protein [Thermoanaerobaculia bacterium]
MTLSSLARSVPVAAIVALMTLLAACNTTPGTPDGGSGGASTPAAAATTGATTPPAGACAAPAAWFPHDKTPAPNPQQAFASFCDFHQWAWQSFLWLTQSSGGKLRFETFPTVDDVIAGKDNSGTRGLVKLAVRTQKVHGPHKSLDEVTQADSLGVLVDHSGHAGYYSQYVNPQMFQQIVSLHWNDPAVLNQIPPATELQTGDVELKVSWKIVAPGEDVSKYYVRPALIDRLVTGPDGKVRIDHSAPPVEVKVALVGFHVVGWVQGHPEAVWATFEQNDNAPDFAPQQSPSVAVSPKNWTFYTASTLALNCNQVDTGKLTLDPATQTLKPATQVCRQFPYGMAATTAASDPNLHAITTLNESVKSQLGNDVARSYFEVGAIWTNGDLKPNDDQQAHRLGSTLLNNSVIETFTQNVQSDNNCFSCHNTLMYNPSDPSIQPLQGTNINLSHIILEAYVDNQPKGKGNR